MSNSSPNPAKLIIVAAAVVTILIAVIVVMTGGFGHNDYENWQIKQSVGGNVEVIDKPGYYAKMFATVWTYPRSVQVFYSKSEKEGTNEDESIGVTFNDGGEAQIEQHGPVQYADLYRRQTKDAPELQRKHPQRYRRCSSPSGQLSQEHGPDDEREREPVGSQGRV